NENFGNKNNIKSQALTNTVESDKSALSLTQFEQFFSKIDTPVSINRLIEDKLTGKDDIMLTAVNKVFVEHFFVQGESLIGRKKAAVYPCLNQIQLNEIANGVRIGKNVRFPYFYHERTSETYDLSVISLSEDKFAMVFQETSDNSSTLNKLKIANSNIEEVKYMLDLSLAIGSIDVWEYDIDSHRLKMIWHDISAEKMSYMLDYALDEYIDWVHPDDQGKFKRNFMNCILKAKGRTYDPDAKFSFDYRIKAPHRTGWIWVSTIIHIIEYTGNNPTTAVAVNVDITRRKKYEDTIKYQLIHDNLTGLLNREGLKNELEQLLARAQKCAIIFLDLDDFKAINDHDGHEYGNKSLKTIAKNIYNNLPYGGIAARLSGDEFLVAFDYDSMRDLKHAADKLLKNISVNLINGRKVTASMGISMYPEHSVKMSELMTFADKAMYVAKENGKNKFVIHNQG
ncbi:MAG: sensor domain-containing diguanylate cyclase, partial [Clostridiales bacterium]|nr:sensor domain-containing diguanylate cyclase [Clostridiales bacterium]